MFKVICVDHVGIACKDLDVSKKFYTEVLGLECTGEEPVPEQGVKTVFIPCGETLLELLVDITENNDGPIGKYIAKNGQGIQHIALCRRNGHCFRSSEICWHFARTLRSCKKIISA